jgi:hypothetical protein
VTTDEMTTDEKIGLYRYLRTHTIVQEPEADWYWEAIDTKNRMYDELTAAGVSVTP